MSRAMSICSAPGCGEEVERGRCAEHSKRRPTNRGTLQDRGYPKDWPARRSRQLKKEPHCECVDCMAIPKDKRPLADLANHIKPVSEGGSHEPDNLESMLKAHHSKHTTTHAPGGFHAFAKRDTLRGPAVPQHYIKRPGDDQPIVGGLVERMRRERSSAGPPADAVILDIDEGWPDVSRKRD